MNFGQRRAGYKIKAFMRKVAAKRRYVMAIRKRRQIGRALPKVGEPVFVETFRARQQNMVVPSGGGLGAAFKIRFTDIPQWQQYEQLYTQYRINWVKVMLLPQYDTTSSDANAANYNATVPAPHVGMARIVYAVQDSPNVQVPANEDDVLQDNGAKIKAIRSKWSCSFKPVPDVTQQTAVGQIYTRQKYRQWFNIDRALVGNNPEHGAVAAYISLPGSLAPNPTTTITYHVYYKVNFSLRDPK